MQIRAAQVESWTLALAFIVPVDGATPTVMRRQQPFDIRTAQGKSSKWVDAASDTEDDHATSGKLLLSRLLNLWLCAPALSP
jgi:hypothetical protein